MQPKTFIFLANLVAYALIMLGLIIFLASTMLDVIVIFLAFGIIVVMRWVDYSRACRCGSGQIQALMDKLEKMKQDIEQTV